jgi:hypothetical protein
MSLTKASYSMITGAPVNVLDFGADPTGVADSSNAIQAAHDAVVATGRKGTLLIPGGTYKCDTGLTINTLFVSVEAPGAVLNFAAKTTGVALTITGNGQVDLGGLRLEGNSATGSVDGISMIGASAGAPVAAVTLRNVSVTTFGRGLVLGNHCYLCEYHNLIIANCFVSIDSIATTNAGAAMRFYGGILINQVSGGTLLRNVNPNFECYMYGTVLDADGLNISLTGGLVELHGGLIEPADFAVVPIQLTGSTSSFKMFGGKITAGASPVTASTLVSCDSTSVTGALFKRVQIDVITATIYLVSGTGAANIIFEGCVSANRNSFAGNALADGSFENGAVLYGSADGTSKFADLVSITVDTGGVPANNLTTGTNLALTFSTDYARTGTKSLKLLKSAALAAPAAFGIFRELPKGNRPSARIWYKKPGSETGTLSISMGFYKIQLDSNGVPILQKQSITTASNVVFTSAAVDWTQSVFFDLYAPPWASHYGISVNAGSMNPCSIYFDDAEISIL